MSSRKRFSPISIKLSLAYALLSFVVLFAMAFFTLQLINNYSSESKNTFEYGYGYVLPSGSAADGLDIPQKDYEIGFKEAIKNAQTVKAHENAELQYIGDNYYFIMQDGRVLLLSYTQMPYSGLTPAILHERNFYIENVGDLTKLVRVAAVNSNYLQWQQFSDYLTTSLIFFAAATLLVAVALGVFISNQITSPLRKIAGAVSKTNVANLGDKIHIKSNDEIGRVADAYNRMSSHLAQSVEAQKRFVADAAHELKTPLSTLTTATSKALQGELKTPEEYVETLEFINLNLYNMKTIVNDLLYIARLEENANAEQEKPLINLEAIGANIYETFLPLCEEKGVMFQVRWRKIYVYADDEKILRLLINLVGNAIKATPKGGLVSAVFGSTDQNAVIVVSDTGAGIAPEHLGKIFNRFYKIPGGGGYNDGTGLGLAICKAIVESNGGEISVQSKVGKGTTFSITLPLAKDISAAGENDEEDN